MCLIEGDDCPPPSPPHKAYQKNLIFRFNLGFVVYDFLENSLSSKTATRVYMYIYVENYCCSNTKLERRFLATIRYNINVSENEEENYANCFFIVRTKCKLCVSLIVPPRHWGSTGGSSWWGFGEDQNQAH